MTLPTPSPAAATASRFALNVAAALSVWMVLYPPFTSLNGTEYAFVLTGPAWSRWADGLGEGLDLQARIHWVRLLAQLGVVWGLALGARRLLRVPRGAPPP